MWTAIRVLPRLGLPLIPTAALALLALTSSGCDSGPKTGTVSAPPPEIQNANNSMLDSMKTKKK